MMELSDNTLTNVNSDTTVGGFDTILTISSYSDRNLCLEVEAWSPK